MHAGLGGLHGIVLVVNGRSGAGEVIDLVDFHIKRECHIMTDEFKAGVADEMVDIALCPGEEVVDAKNIMTVSK